MTAFEHWLVHFFYVGTAQRKDQLVVLGERQDRVKEVVGREHCALSYTKVRIDVMVSGLKDNLWVTFHVHSILLNERVEGSADIVIDILVSLGLMIQFDRVGAAATEGIAGIKRSYNV